VILGGRSDYNGRVFGLDSSSNKLMAEVTQILQAIERGDAQAAAQLLPLVYEELRRLAASKLAGSGPTTPCSRPPGSRGLPETGRFADRELSGPRPFSGRRGGGHAPDPH